VEMGTLVPLNMDEGSNLEEIELEDVLGWGTLLHRVEMRACLIRNSS